MYQKRDMKEDLYYVSKPLHYLAQANFEVKVKQNTSFILISGYKLTKTHKVYNISLVSNIVVTFNQKKEKEKNHKEFNF